MNDYGLPDSTVQRLVDVFKKFPEIEEVILFGSRAKGTYKPGSNIDLALRGERCSAELAWKLQGFINEELPIPYQVDVVDYQSLADPHFKENIDQSGKIFYRRSPSP